GDVREELPVLFLRLRAAALGGRTSILELSPRETSLTRHAAVSLRYRPGEAAGLVGALTEGPDPADPELAEARRLLGAEDVVVVAGRPSLAEDGTLVADALCRLARALPGARFLCGLRRGNVRGALEMGLAPGLLPGRVALEDGRGWFSEAWGRVPERRGLDTAGMLASVAGEPGGDDGEVDRAGEVRALVLLGAEPLSDFPDRRLARRALEAARFVVAVTSQPAEECELADVVLPAAEAHERRGTTTNVEGRISRLGHRVAAPGQAWPDWMIAIELAAHLGADLGFDSLPDVWDEIERLAPSHRGITGALLDDPVAADGVVVPLAGGSDTAGRQLPSPIDPIAIPGVESVERQGAPLRAGLAELPEALEEPSVAAGAPGDPSGGPAGAARDLRPPTIEGPPEVVVPDLPATGGGMRLVAWRTLYDHGTAVAASPALAALVRPATLHVHPSDLDELGVEPGGQVRVRPARGGMGAAGGADQASGALVATTADPSLPRGVVAAEFNVPFGEAVTA
ncbi:MAG TPA: molybdopterin-dependent oxidoreductase, partial [Acidimicrobiales bacterium]|nr:molybdopterin-dependent oxidoreductase [Acidimicrobiales bacterium]